MSSEKKTFKGDDPAARASMRAAAAFALALINLARRLSFSSRPPLVPAALLLPPGLILRPEILLLPPEPLSRPEVALDSPGLSFFLSPPGGFVTTSLLVAGASRVVAIAFFFLSGVQWRRTR